MIMRKLSVFLFGTLVGAGLAVAQPAPAFAELKAPVIAILDAQTVMQQATSMKGVQKQLESQREVYQKEISAQEDKLRSAQQELAKQQSILSKEVFQAKQRDFQKQVEDTQKTVQARRRALEQASAEAQGKVVQAMLEVVEEVAKEQGATLVLQKQSAVLADKSLDITATVLERLNKKLPQTSVAIPKK